MKIFVAGSTGRVATELLKKLSAKNYQVIAGARRPEAVVELPNVTPQKMDLHASVDDITGLLKGVDAVVFTAGSRGKDLLQTDAYGAVKLMQAAKEVGITRFVMLSALYSLTPDKWPDNLTDYYIAKFFADNYLVNQSGLDYTIVQPGNLLEEAGQGRITLGDKGFTAISIEDVASVLAEIVDKPSTFKRVIAINPGSTAISQLFN
ncbi:Putative NADH-flavin reductase [Streptococcus gallolyticus]|uniref:Putative NADH-flavin reductase n=1 Tax=Streptococcus gallolyticus TaxID=315405 RepID=A0A1H7TY26_9STRE|nr:SDR family oxidoreductase [Streptococcus gallolyticus]SEF20286.1 Putative NADH-flavin reductase [Streptococcus gallolyticus]SEL89465.1 Putative NADH-flavin reductase [Streptococcus gallolyticus]